MADNKAAFWLLWTLFNNLSYYPDCAFDVPGCETARLNFNTVKQWQIHCNKRTVSRSCALGTSLGTIKDSATQLELSNAPSPPTITTPISQEGHWRLSCLLLGLAQTPLAACIFVLSHDTHHSHMPPQRHMHCLRGCRRRKYLLANAERQG